MEIVPNPAPARRKMVHEEFLERLNAFLEEQIRKTPEVRGLLVAIDWNVGQNDFPPCLVVSSDVSEKTTLDMMKQTVKLLDHLGHMFSQQILKADSVLRYAEQVIQKNSAESPVKIDSSQ